MKIEKYVCDRCGETIDEVNLTKVTFAHGHGKFDLRDEEFHLCPVCDEVVTIEMQNQRKRP